MSIDVAWERIEAWLKAHAQDVFQSLKPPARLPSVKKLETDLGVTLPSDFAASVARHNGQSDDAESGLFPHSDDVLGPEPAWRLLSLKEIKSFWGMMKELAEAGDFVGQTTDPGPGVRSDWWCSGWVPFADNGGGDAICLDMTPATGGRTGQVILFLHAGPDRPVLAGSFEELLTRLADGLESGRYVCDPDEGLIEAVADE